MWQLYFTKQAQKDAKKLASSGLKIKAQQLLHIPITLQDAGVSV